MANLAKTRSRVQSQPLIELSFDSFRNITSPSDKAQNRKIFTGQLPITEIVGLPTDDNVRDYLVEAEGKQRKTPTQVHRAIRDTLINDPGDFGVLNSGVVIVARDYEVDEQRKVMRLLRPSIINGSQTQGVIRDFFKDFNKDEISQEPIFIKFELVVSGDEDLIAETSISRNYQNDVKQLSIVGRRGRLDELEAALSKKMDGAKLRKDETDLAGLPTEKLLQVITALIPEELWVKVKPAEAGEPNKVYTYSMKAKCLKEFDTVYTRSHNVSDPERSLYSEVYNFYLDIAADAWKLYNIWKKHQDFQGTGIKNGLVREEDGRTIKEVQDGMIFPILAALSVFAMKTTEGWEIRPPATFDDKDLIQAAIRAYQRIAHSNPWNMGKDRGCYSMCYEVTSLYKKLSKKNTA